MIGKNLSHCYSGRIVYRPDPHTPDVWQYKDTQDWSSDATVRKKWEQGKEMKPKGFGKGKALEKAAKESKAKRKANALEKAHWPSWTKMQKKKKEKKKRIRV